MYLKYNFWAVAKEFWEGIYTYLLLHIQVSLGAKCFGLSLTIIKLNHVKVPIFDCFWPVKVYMHREKWRKTYRGFFFFLTCVEDFFKLKYSWFIMFCQSALQQGDSVIRIYIHILCLYPFHYGLPQETRLRSLCWTVGPWCLSIRHVVVRMYQPPNPSPPPPSPLPLGFHKSDHTENFKQMKFQFQIQLWFSHFCTSTNPFPYPVDDYSLLDAELQ